MLSTRRPNPLSMSRCCAASYSFGWISRYRRDCQIDHDVSLGRAKPNDGLCRVQDAARRDDFS
jgi:hypothetical protein